MPPVTIGQHPNNDKDVAMKKVAIYARVSTDKQSTDNQLRELRAIADKNGWELVNEFVDEGISGAKGRDKLGENTHSSPTLCVKYENKIIPLSTPDARPILMNMDNAIEIPTSE